MRKLLWVLPLLTSFCCFVVVSLASQIPKKTAAELIVERARLEATSQVAYDSSYQKIKYPGGDVPQDRGVCTDVIVRALRAAGYDLQQLLHDDKRRNPRNYPAIGGSRRLDSNIDHRRCANQIVFMRRHAKELTTKLDKDHLAEWQAGDLAYIDLDPGKGRLLHCGVVSDARNEEGIPYLIHNIGPTAREEDVLKNFRLYCEIIGHHRYPDAK